MISKLLGLAVAVAFVMGAGAALAEVKSGLEPGRKVGPFLVKKVTILPDDGVDKGKELCYRCKYDDDPMVIIFSRKPSAELNKLAHELDGAVSEHSSVNLRAFVNLLGDDQEQLEAKAAAMSKDARLKHVPVVVPVEHASGPEDYNINPKAEVTVLLVHEGEVRESQAYEHLDAKAIDHIVGSVKQIID